jgi:hypothetical protein
LTLQKNSHNFTKIAFKPLQTNLFNIVLASFFLTMGCANLYAQDIAKKTTAITLKVDTSSLDINKDKHLYQP